MVHVERSTSAVRLYRNFIELFKDSRFLAAIYRTFLFSGGALVFEVLFGVAIALLLNRNFIGKNVVKTLFLLPMVATPVSIGLVWMLIYEPTLGIANYILSLVGVQKPPVWLGASDSALASLILVDIWQWTPMISLIVLAGLSALPSEPFESARVDGASWRQMLMRITLPMVSPTITVAILLRLIDVMKTFDIIYATTKGGPNFSTETLNIFAFTQAFQYFSLGTASAVLVLFFSIVFGISLILLKFRKRIEILQ